jgi:cell division protein FtsZ
MRTFGLPVAAVPTTGSPTTCAPSWSPLASAWRRGRKTGTANAPGPVDYHQLDQVPAVIRRNRASTVEALQQSGVDKYDIPAFLRKQAD